MPLETSKNLWNHTLNWHEVDTHFSIIKVATQQANYIKHTLQNVVIISQSSVHEYTAVKATLFWHDAKQKMTICLDTESITMFIDWSLVNKAKIKWTSLIMTENFFRKQVLNQLMKLLIIIVILSSSIRLNIIVYLVNDLCTEVLLSTDILIREEVNIDLKQNKLTIDYWEADLVFKTSQNSTDMHIIMQPTMHEIFCQQRLNYAALLSQFQVKTPSHQGKLPALTALSTLSLTLLCEGTTSNCHMNIVSHLIVVNLYNHFCHDTKTLQDFISI